MLEKKRRKNAYTPKRGVGERKTEKTEKQRKRKSQKIFLLFITKESRAESAFFGSPYPKIKKRRINIKTKSEAKRKRESNSLVPSPKDIINFFVPIGIEQKKAKIEN